MKLLTRILAVTVLLFAAAACHKDEIIPVGEPAQLRSIIPASVSLEIEGGEKADLYITVKDNGFDLLARPVALLRTDGKSSSNVSLAGISRDNAISGRYLVKLADQSADITYEEKLQLAVSLEGGSTVLSSPFTVTKNIDPTAPDYMKTGLPVVYVNTDGGKAITSKTTFITANMSIRGAGGHEGLTPVSCNIRGRGNTTWTWPKKPYLLKLDEQRAIFGMPKHKRWVLLANFMDRTLMRNMVSMHVAQMTRLDWTPHCVPVELVLNGVHQGTYLLIEQVRVDNDRVNIIEMTPEDNSGDALTGGWLLELDFHYDNTFQWKERNIPFAVKDPDPDQLTDAQKNYIKNYIKEVSNTIYGSNYADPANGYAKYLDVDSFVDYWIVFEVMCNHELGNPGSVFLHKDRGGRLTAGPCWDFDWGVLSFKTTPGDRRLINGHAIWYDRLFQDPAFKEKVKTRFYELLPRLQMIPGYMEDCEILLEKSAALNFEMWNPAEDRSQNGGQIINGDEELPFHEAVEHLKSNFNTHLEIIKKNL